MARANRKLIAAAAVLLGVALASRPAAAGSVEFTLKVSPTQGGMGDNFVATVRIDVAGVSGPEQYSPPSFNGFTVVNRSSNQTTSMTFDPQHGQQLRTIELRRYALRPTRGGHLTIGPAEMHLNGKTYKSNRVAVVVQGQGGSGGTQGQGGSGGTQAQSGPTTGIDVPGYKPPRSAGRSMFVDAVADRTNVYVGQQVVVTWLLYTRSDILQFEPHFPSMDGLWSDVLYQPKRYFNYHEAMVDGVPYEVAVVSKRALFPTRSGKVVIAPYVADVATLRSALGGTIPLQSNPITLDVKPLPAGAPPGFDPSYVGNFQVKASVDRPSIDAGESFTLTVTVSGEGAIRRTTAPVVKVAGLKIRQPRGYDQKVDTSTDVVKGRRTYRYWITPQRGGAQTIPPIRIPFFNPKTGRYEVAQSKPIPIVVHGDPSQVGSKKQHAAHENVIARDIRLIRPGRSISSRIAPRLYRNRWFWLVAAFPPFAFFAVIIGDRIRAGLQKETPRSRIRRARGRAQKRLRVAELHLKAERAPQFFGEIARVLYAHVEERVGRPVQSMTRDELARFLSEKGFDAGTIAALDSELENCDFARFAPSASGPGEMRAALRRTRDLLRAIEKSRVADEAANETGAAA